MTETVGKMRTSMRWILSYSSLVPHQLRTPVAVMRSQLEDAMHERATRVINSQQVVASTYDEILKLNDSKELRPRSGNSRPGAPPANAETPHEEFPGGFAREAGPLAGCKNIEFGVEEPYILFHGRYAMDTTGVVQHVCTPLIRHTPEGGQIRARYAINGPMISTPPTLG